MNTPFVIALSSSPFRPVGSKGRYVKELIRAGSFYKASDGLRFDVTPELLQHWAMEFARMQENGVKVPVPEGHSVEASKNRGWVTGMYVEDDSLFGIIDFTVENAKDLAASSDVSIYAQSQFIDGEGNEYVRPITHVALCTDPVITGLGEFVEIAASHVPVLKEKTMDWTQIKDALGIESDITDENAEELVLSAASKLKDDLQAKIAELEAATQTNEPDPVMLSLARDNREMKLQKLVELGAITPSVKTKLEKAFVDDGALKLTLSSGTFDKVVLALKENKAVSSGEKSGHQTVALSHRDESPLVKNAKARSEKA